MKYYATAVPSMGLIKNVCIDSAALAFVYFTPLIAHLIAFPIYMIEPMRLMVILSLVHSSPRNSYLLAFTLPLFSYIATSHPEFFKMLIITAELVLNVFFFYWLSSRMKNVFFEMIIAIFASKAVCYLLYLIFFSITFVRNEASLPFLIVQIITTLVFSTYIFIFWKKQSMND